MSMRGGSVGKKEFMEYDKLGSEEELVSEKELISGEGFVCVDLEKGESCWLCHCIIGELSEACDLVIICWFFIEKGLPNTALYLKCDGFCHCIFVDACVVVVESSFGGVSREVVEVKLLK